MNISIPIILQGGQFHGIKAEAPLQQTNLRINSSFSNVCFYQFAGHALDGRWVYECMDMNRPDNYRDDNIYYN